MLVLGTHSRHRHLGTSYHHQASQYQAHTLGTGHPTTGLRLLGTGHTRGTGHPRASHLHWAQASWHWAWASWHQALTAGTEHFSTGHPYWAWTSQYQLPPPDIPVLGTLTGHWASPYQAPPLGTRYLHWALVIPPPLPKPGREHGHRGTDQPLDIAQRGQAAAPGMVAIPGTSR